MKMEEAERTCPECGRIVLGRHDKRFCSDLCRNAHNNKINRQANNLIRNVNNILKKNRRILEKIAPNGKAKTNRQKLNQLGFDFTLHTSIYTTKAGATYYFCYDYGYLELDNDWFAIVKKD